MVGKLTVVLRVVFGDWMASNGGERESTTELVLEREGSCKPGRERGIDADEDEDGPLLQVCVGPFFMLKISIICLEFLLLLLFFSVSIFSLCLVSSLSFFLFFWSVFPFRFSPLFSCVKLLCFSVLCVFLCQNSLVFSSPLCSLFFLSVLLSFSLQLPPFARFSPYIYRGRGSSHAYCMRLLPLLLQSICRGWRVAASCSVASVFCRGLRSNRRPLLQRAVAASCSCTV